MQLYWIYYVLPLMGVTLTPFVSGVMALGMNFGAYGAEIVRSIVRAEGITFNPALVPEMLASGGPTIAGRAYIVGERGPELWMEKRPGYMLDAAQTAGLRTAAVAPSVTVNVNAGAFLGYPNDAQRLGRELAPVIKREFARLAGQP